MDLTTNQHCRLTTGFWGDHYWVSASDQYHRVAESGVQDGPAVVFPNGDQFWYLDGKCHRLDGPAIIDSFGNQFWFLDDQDLPQEQWAQDCRVIEFNSRTPQSAEQWLKRM